MKFMFGERGATLVELMVVAAMMGGMALVGAQLTSNMNKGVTTVETKSDLVQTFSEIRGYLSSVPACTNTLGTTTNYSSCEGTAKPTAAPCLINAGEIRDQNNLIKFAINNNPNTAQAKVGNALHLHSAWINEYSVPSGGSGNMKLNILFKNLKFDRKAAYGPAEVVKSIPLNVSVNVANMITSCQNASSGTNDIWAYFPDFNGIFYNAGGVVVGTTVDGTIHPGPSFSVGEDNAITKSRAGAIGSNNTVDAMDAVALGRNNIVNSTRGNGGGVGLLGSAAIGVSNQALSPQSVAIGYASLTSQRFGVAIGAHNRNNAHASTLLGHWNAAGDPATDNVYNQGGHGVLALGMGNGNTCANTSYTNTDYLMGYYNVVIGNDNKTTNNARTSMIFGNNLQSDATGTLSLGDASINKAVTACGATSTNNIANSLMARFEGGYRLYVEKGTVNDTGLFIKNNPHTNTAPNPATQKAWVGVNQQNPTSPNYVFEASGGDIRLNPLKSNNNTPSTVATNNKFVSISTNASNRAFVGINFEKQNSTIPLVLRSQGNVHLSAPIDPACPMEMVGNPLSEVCIPTTNANRGSPIDGLWIINNPFTGPLGMPQGRTWVGINMRTPTDDKHVFEVNGLSKLKQETWQNVPISNVANWSLGCLVPDNSAKFIKDSMGFVRLRGAVRRTGAGNAQIGALPVGYRPAHQVLFMGVTNDYMGGIYNPGACQILINHGGFITIMDQNNPGNLPLGKCCSLDQVSFFAEN